MKLDLETQVPIKPDEKDDDDKEALIPKSPTIKSIPPSKLPPKKDLSRFFLKRTRMRYLTLLLVPFLIFLLFLTLYFISIDKGTKTFHFKEDSFLSLSVKNCQITLQKHLKNTITIEYFLQNNPWTGEPNGPTFFVEKKDSNIEVKAFSDSLDLSHCRINIFLPKNEPINEISIFCEDESQCVIIKEGRADILEIKTLEIQSNGAVFANMEGLKVNSLSFEAEKGVLQISDSTIDTGDVVLTHGDIIFQTEKDLKIEFQNSLQAFCFSAPFFKKSETSECNLSENSISSYYYFTVTLSL